MVRSLNHSRNSRTCYLEQWSGLIKCVSKILACVGQTGKKSACSTVWRSKKTLMILLRSTLDSLVRICSMVTTHEWLDFGDVWPRPLTLREVAYNLKLLLWADFYAIWRGNGMYLNPFCKSNKYIWHWQTWMLYVWCERAQAPLKSWIALTWCVPSFDFCISIDVTELMWHVCFSFALHFCLPFARDVFSDFETSAALTKCINRNVGTLTRNSK